MLLSLEQSFQQCRCTVTRGLPGPISEDVYDRSVTVGTAQWRCRGIGLQSLRVRETPGPLPSRPELLGCQWQACSCPCCQQMPVYLTVLIAVTKRHQDIVSFAPSLCKRQLGEPCPHFIGKKSGPRRCPAQDPKAEGLESCLGFKITARFSPEQ